MNGFDRIDLQRVAMSSLGAMAVSAACIFAAVGPARAAAPQTAGAWQSAVERQIDARGSADPALVRASAGNAQIALHFLSDGRFAGAELVRSTGDRTVDATAVRLARAIRYPVLPASFRGNPQTIRMNLLYGQAAEIANRVESARKQIRDEATFGSGRVELAGR